MANGSAEIMIVTEVVGETVICVWYAKDQLIRHLFPVSTLRLIEGNDGYRSFT